MPGLPKILCLHGGGSSAAVFKAQSRMVQVLLRDRFEFVFVNAPFASAIGPDLAPTYSDCGPFYRWHTQQDDDDDDVVERERTIVRDYLGGIVTAAPRAAPFVGVMGFSNGAGVATSLIVERHELAALWGDAAPTFRFAWLFCGTYPPISLLPRELQKARRDSVQEQEQQPMMSSDFVSIHMLGLRDPYLLQSRKLLHEVYEAATGSKAYHVEFPGAHHMPVKKEDVAKFRTAVETVLRHPVVVQG